MRRRFAAFVRGIRGHQHGEGGRGNCALGSRGKTPEDFRCGRCLEETREAIDCGVSIGIQAIHR